MLSGLLNYFVLLLQSLSYCFDHTQQCCNTYALHINSLIFFHVFPLIIFWLFAFINLIAELVPIRSHQHLNISKFKTFYAAGNFILRGSNVCFKKVNVFYGCAICPKACGGLNVIGSCFGNDFAHSNFFFFCEIAGFNNHL